MLIRQDDRNELCTSSRTELGHRAADMRAYGLRGHMELRCDLRGLPAERYQGDHFTLTVGQGEVGPLRGGRRRCGLVRDNDIDREPAAPDELQPGREIGRDLNAIAPYQHATSRIVPRYQEALPFLVSSRPVRWLDARDNRPAHEVPVRAPEQGQRRLVGRDNIALLVSMKEGRLSSSGL